MVVFVSLTRCTIAYMKKVFLLALLVFAGADGAPVGNKYGVTGFPTTLIGKTEIRGDEATAIVSALAETYGKEVLTPGEHIAMDKHYDSAGRARVVMYGTSWCG